MNHHEQVPIWGYINLQLLYQIHCSEKKGESHKTTITELIDLTSNHIGSEIPLSEFWAPINVGTIFSFLYSVIVVPKEIYGDEDNPFFDEFPIKISELFKSVSIGRDKLDSNFSILRFLRNSISHVNYSVDSNDGSTIEMWNKKRNDAINIKVTTDIDLLSNFGVRISNYYTSTHLANKRMESND